MKGIESSISYFEMLITYMLLSLFLFPLYFLGEKADIFIRVINFSLMILCFSYYLKKRNSSLKKFMGKKEINLFYIFRQFIFIYLIFIFITSSVYIIRSFITPNSFIMKESRIESFSYMETIPFIISALFLAPIKEEILFRGLLLRIFSKNNIKYGIFFSSLIFSFMHGEDFFSYFVGGLLLALVYIKSKSLYSSILCHSLVNITGLSIYFITKNNPVITYLEYRTTLLGTGITSFIIILIILAKYKGDFKIDLKDEGKEDIKKVEVKEV